MRRHFLRRRRRCQTQLCCNFFRAFWCGGCVLFAQPVHENVCVVWCWGSKSLRYLGLSNGFSGLCYVRGVCPPKARMHHFSRFAPPPSIGAGGLTGRLGVQGFCLSCIPCPHIPLRASAGIVFIGSCPRGTDWTKSQFIG